ncbi:hypothetical protein [Flavobacterium suzhouense]|uniref:Lipoprotein n=1 Tax=Flavobacterium suzhouense TaxID=1529638 RepID=A0ABW5NT67_9FLAO
MKKIMLKGLICALMLSVFWSCSTENDVQMQSTTQVQQKTGDVLSGVIGENLGNGIYKIVVDERELMSALEDVALQENGVQIKIDNISIVNKFATNSPSIPFPVLTGGGLSTDGSSMSFAYVLTEVNNNFMIGSSGHERPPLVMCRGCARGCFLEFYELDATHLLGYCDSAGCGDYCFRIKLE